MLRRAPLALNCPAAPAARRDGHAATMASRWRYPALADTATRVPPGCEHDRLVTKLCPASTAPTCCIPMRWRALTRARGVAAARPAQPRTGHGGRGRVPDPKPTPSTPPGGACRAGDRVPGGLREPERGVQPMEPEKGITLTLPCQPGQTACARRAGDRVPGGLREPEHCVQPVETDGHPAPARARPERLGVPAVRLRGAAARRRAPAPRAPAVGEVRGVARLGRMQALHAPPCAGSMCALHCPWATAAMHESAPCAARLCTLTPSPAQLRVRGSRLAAAAAAAGLLARCDRAPAQPQPGPRARLLPCPLVTPSPIRARPHAADQRHRRVHIPLVHAQHHAQQQWHALVPAVQRRRPGLGRHRPRRAGARGAALHRSAVWPEWRSAVMEHGSIAAAEPHVTCLRRLPGPHLTCCGLTCMGEDDSVCSVAQSDTPTSMLGSAVSARRGCQLPSSAGWLGAHRVGG